MFSKEEISRFVDSEDLGEQSICLPYGIKTPGDNRGEAIEVVLGELKKSQTVLDIGSSLGLFCLTCLQHGARAVTGFELNRDSLSRAKRIADFLQLKPQYLRLNVEEYPDVEKHDIVLCLNLLRYLRNPVGVLRYLASRTSDTLIIETAHVGDRDVKSIAKFWGKASKLHRLPGFLMRLLVASLFTTTSNALVAPYSPKTSLRAFSFSKTALDAVLSTHMKLFYSVQIKPSRLKDRYFVVCKKLKIKHLILVSGACGSGKSTFIEKALPGGCSSTLGLNDESFAVVSGSVIRSRKLSKFFPGQVNDSVVFHYDILPIHKCGINSYDRDPSLDVLMCAEKVSVVMLAPEKDQLLNQMIASETTNGSMSKYHSDLRNKYQSPGWLSETYLDWLDFLGRRLADVDSCDVYDYHGLTNQLNRVSSIQELRGIVENRYS